MTPANAALYNWINRAFDFRGRATRSDYWWPRLLVIMVNVVLGTLFLEGGGEAWFTQLVELSEAAEETGVVSFDDFDLPPLTSLGTFALTASFVFVVFTFMPMLSLSWRRLQDMGKPGWIHILFLVACTVISPLMLWLEFIWLAFPGTRGPNRYGPDKLNAEADIF